MYQYYTPTACDSCSALLCRLCTCLQLLEHLCLSHSRLAAAELRLVGQLPHLEALSLAYCSSLDDDALAALHHAPRLARVDLRGCGALTGAGVRGLLEALPQLHALYVDARVPMLCGGGGGDERLVGCSNSEVALMV